MVAENRLLWFSPNEIKCEVKNIFPSLRGFSDATELIDEADIYAKSSSFLRGLR